MPCSPTTAPFLAGLADGKTETQQPVLKPSRQHAAPETPGAAPHFPDVPHLERKYTVGFGPGAATSTGVQFGKMRPVLLKKKITLKSKKFNKNGNPTGPGVFHRFVSTCHLVTKDQACESESG